MKTCGIIAEYNPFHKGHIYHLEQARKISQADALVVIVSGFYSQRGLPSLLDSSTKAKLALEHGADLVLELPTCYACQSAQYFSKYALESLSSLKIDSLCFGSESCDLQALEQLIETNRTTNIDPTQSMNQNLNRQIEPNDLLGYHYIQDCHKYGITPLPIKRSDLFKSATQTRKDYFNGMKQDFDQYFHTNQQWSNYYPILRTILLMSKPEWLASFFLINEGIEYRLIQAAKDNKDWAHFLQQASSKTYSYNRIMRSCLMILLQITKEEMEQNSSFFGIKVLGMNQKGRLLLKQASTPIYTKYKDYPPFLQRVHQKSIDLYNSQESSIITQEVLIYE